LRRGARVSCWTALTSWDPSTGRRRRRSMSGSCSCRKWWGNYFLYGVSHVWNDLAFIVPLVQFGNFSLLKNRPYVSNPSATRANCT
jgi:hypothetical protein